MNKSTEDLIREINELKSELKQMKEIISMLFNMVVDSETEEDEEYISYPDVGSVDSPRFNT